MIIKKANGTYSDSVKICKERGAILPPFHDQMFVEEVKEHVYELTKTLPFSGFYVGLHKDAIGSKLHWSDGQELVVNENEGGNFSVCKVEGQEVNVPQTTNPECYQFCMSLKTICMIECEYRGLHATVCLVPERKVARTEIPLTTSPTTTKTSNKSVVLGYLIASIPFVLLIGFWYFKLQEQIQLQ